MDTKYLKYNAEEFAADESFQNWVVGNEDGDKMFWNNWVENFPEKAEDVELAKKIVDLVKFKKEQVSENELTESWKNIQSEINTKGKKINLNFSLFTKIAASIAILLSMASLVWILNSRTNNDLYADFVVPNGQQSCVNLPDGTVVWLNSGSKFSYSCNFGKKQRLVKLDGQAFFDVVKDKNRPFIVKTKHLDVEVLGTAFDVMAYADEEVIRTTLVRGKVKVKISNKESEYLEPGQACFYSVYSKKAQVKHVNTEEYTSWREGQIRFNNETFENIARNLERKFNVLIIIENKMLAKERYTGEFMKEDSLKKIFEIFNLTTEFDYKINGDTITIK